jgi:hypothetical protein
MSGLWLVAQGAADGVRCLSEQTASLAEPYPSPDIDDVKPAP